MRWLELYLRSRRAPMAMAATGGCGVLMWSLWSIFSDTREAGFQMVVLTILLLVIALTGTLAGPDDALESTAALRWPPRRLAHLLGAFLLITLLPLLSLATGAHFGPGEMVIRDAGGLLGLTALGAATIGAARAWFLPLGWTMGAVLFPQDGTLGEVLTWQSQPPQSTASAVMAGVLALSGLVVYGLAGPARKAPAEAAQL